MTDISLNALYRRILENPDGPATLIDAAAGVANAISAGLGGCVQGTLMEAEFRRALCLKDGEMVNIPRAAETQSEQ